MDWRDFLEEWAFTITLGLLLVGILLMLSGCSTLDALKAQTKNTVEVLDEAGGSVGGVGPAIKPYSAYDLRRSRKSIT